MTGDFPAPRFVWLAIADHFEPLGGGASEELAAQRVVDWRRRWPQIATAHADSAGRPPVYTFFYPEEEYRPGLLEPLAELTAEGTADVEVHIHHDGEGQQDFVDRISSFSDTLFACHGLLRKENGRIRFGFIHGNWALDNSLPRGKWCGLNNEISILRNLGCYADFTMPSVDSPSQAHKVNTIYWANDDPQRPKSYDTGIPLEPGRARGDLLMIPGPLAIRWRERFRPRIDGGELAGYDLPSRYRVSRWIEVAPRLGEHIFIKLFTHGAQERNSGPLLNGGLENLFGLMMAECRQRSLQLRFVSTWQMYQAVMAIWKEADPLMTLSPGLTLA